MCTRSPVTGLQSVNHTDSSEEALLPQEARKPEEDRRANKRYRVSARARFRWQNSAGKWISSTGVTRDMSVAGAYILCSNVPDIRSAIELQVAVTPLHQGPTKASLFGRGFVTRTNTGAGFAAELVLQLFRIDQSDPTDNW